jgi:hypothetical protein
MFPCVHLSTGIRSVQPLRCGASKSNYAPTRESEGELGSALQHTTVTFFPDGAFMPDCERRNQLVKE